MYARNTLILGVISDPGNWETFLRLEQGYPFWLQKVFGDSVWGVGRMEQHPNGTMIPEIHIMSTRFARYLVAFYGCAIVCIVCALMLDRELKI